jgi:hypothetical protein
MSDESIQDKLQAAATEAEKLAPELKSEDLKEVVGGAAKDYFLKIEGVDGESQDDKHKGEIQLD